MTNAIPARTSGLVTTALFSRAGPFTTARWGSHRMMSAPILTSQSMKNMRVSYIFSWMRTAPRIWVEATVMMLSKSAGKPGQGASSIFGVPPSRALRMVLLCLAGIMIDEGPVSTHSIPIPFKA